MKVATRTVFLLMAVVLPAASQTRPCPQQPPAVTNVTITVAPAKQPDAPLEITGFRLAPTVNVDPIVVVKSRTERPVKSFVFYVIVQRADGQTGQPGVAGEASVYSTVSSDWPADAAVPQRLLSVHSLAGESRSVLSDCLHAAIVLYHVEFEDGTTWGREVWGLEDWVQKAWQSSLPPDPAPVCRHTPGIEKFLREMRGLGIWSDGRPNSHRPDIVPSYRLSCPMRNYQGSVSARCQYW